MTTATAERSSAVEAVVADPGFRRLKQKVIATTGLQYYADNDQTLAERIEQRRVTLGCGRADYFRRILDLGDAEELAALVDNITVGETYFFRYPEQFEALRRIVIPERIARCPADRTLRIWSAGCASGAEPYSLAILLRRDLADVIAGWRYSILGTDINRQAVASAQAGLFSNWELRTATDDMKRQCFVEADTRWSLRPEYREGVRFEYQNLVTDIDTFADTHRGGFDIIFCRNVMIYFGPELMRHLLRRFGDCLAPGGWLIVGHAEPYFEIANFFSPTKVAGATIYRKLDGNAAHDEERGDWPSAPDSSHEPVRGYIHVALDDGPLNPFAFPCMAPVAAFENTAGAPPALPADSPASATGAVSAASTATALEIVRRHADTGAWNAAIEACEQAMLRHPLDAALHYARALIFEHIGTLAETEQALGRAIYLDRAFALAHYHLGRCRATRDDKKAAAQSFANALKILAGRDDTAALTMGDGLTVSELRELIRVQLELLEAR